MKRSEAGKKAYLTYLLKMYQFPKKLIRWLLVAGFRICLALYKAGFRICSKLYMVAFRRYSFCCNIMRSLKTFVERRLNLTKDNNVLVQIDISEYSPIILRDLLIALNNIGNQILSSESRSANLSLNIYGDAKNIELSDIFTCCQMNPFVGDINFVLTDRARAENNAVVHGPTKVKKIANLDIKVSSDGMDLQLQGKNYLKAIHRNCLRVPQLSTRVWASNMLKTFKPASFFVCFHVPESDPGNGLSRYTEWRLFFMRVWETIPCVHFLLLNYSLDWGKEFAIDLPNVTLTKMLGYNLLEEIAIVQSADMYMGSFDKYAAVVIGSEKPFLLFGLNETVRNTLAELMDPASQLLLERKNQILIAKDILPDSLFDYFRRFYMRFPAKK